MKLKKLYEANQWWNDWKLQLHWNKLEWVSPRSQIKRNKPYSVSSQKKLNKVDIKSHWVGHSKLKELDTNHFFEKEMIEDMESDLTESSEINPKTDNLTITEEADVYEAIPIYLQRYQKTQAYKKTMKIDI